MCDSLKIVRIAKKTFFTSESVHLKLIELTQIIIYFIGNFNTSMSIVNMHIFLEVHSILI